MSDDDGLTPDLSIRYPPKILIPVRVLEGQGVPEPLVTFLAPAEIVVLGYHVLPDQTPTEQGSMQFEERARAAVEDIAEAFRAAGRTVETRVAFTHDRDQTVARVAEEVGATAVLLPNPTGAIERVLVAVRGAIDTDRLADLVSTLVDDDGGTVTLWGLETGAADVDVAAAVERVRTTVVARGMSEKAVTVETATTETPVVDTVERSAEFDVVVMGESEPTLLSMLLGDDADRVARGAVAPVLVVRRSPTE